MSTEDTFSKVKISKKRKLISVGLSLVFLALIIYYIGSNWDDFRSLTVTRPSMLVGLALAVVANLFITGMIMDVVLRPLGLRLHVMETFGLASLTRISNQVSPGKVGLFIRAAYLKKKHRFSYVNFMSSLAGTHILLFFVASLLGLFSIWVLTRTGINIHSFFILTFSGVSLVLLMFIVVPMSLPVSNKPIIKHLFELLNGWQLIRRNRRTVIAAAFWSLMLLFSSAATLFFAFGSLGANITVTTALFIASVNIVNAVFAITPSGFGVSEGMILLASTAVGLNPTTALAVALLQRIFVFITTLIITPFFSRRLFNLSLRKLIKNKYSL